ncbi:MAG: hypothetical protein DI534_00570 [Leifsonia xyli]|nr:MAG: hypothetical protein DI534_00570 [Leifsonia xyli]
MSRTRVSALPVAFVAIAATTFALAGCTPTPEPTPTQSNPPAPSPSTEPAGLTCDEILPTAALDSALGTSFTLNAAFAPAAGSAGATIAAAGGVACEWSDSSGATVLVAAGAPGTSAIEAGKTLAASAGTPTTIFGASLTAYQSGQGGTTFDVFSETGNWVQTTSSLYTDPSDVTSIVAQIMQALPSG